MAGFYERKWSSAALWCERLAMLCIPYFALTIGLHRFGKISSLQAAWLLVFGFALIVASLFLGIRALQDLWSKGLRGGKATVRGVVVATLFAVPYVWHGYLAVEHPMLADVATNPYTPPQFEMAQAARDRANDGASAFAVYNDAYADLLIAEYPKVGSRRYNAGPERVLASVRLLVAERGWEIVQIRGLPEDSGALELLPAPGEAETGSKAKPAAEAKTAGKADKPKAAEPAPAPSETVIPANIDIEAVASTLLFGFKHDLVIQIISEAEATLVDMRAASRYGAHDFGGNAKLIEEFLGALDTSLLGIAGEG